jgi:hypothetical protein
MRVGGGGGGNERERRGKQQGEDKSAGGRGEIHGRVQAVASGEAGLAANCGASMAAGMV